jgi:hypothetical protein
MEAFFGAILLFSILISTFSIMMSLWCLTEVPANPEFEKVTKDLEEKMNKDIFEAV